MSKSVYSIVLTDEIVDRIDRLAYEENTNRSNMINKILAEYVSYVTPEQKMHDTFERMKQLLIGPDGFRMVSDPSESMMSVRSAISYKYNPTVRYSVELNRNPDDRNVGVMKVQLRTQNETLVQLMNAFLALWVSLEAEVFDDVVSEIQSGGRFIRVLTIRNIGGPVLSAITADTLAELISDYFSAFDSALKSYFYCLENPFDAEMRVRTVYSKYISISRITL